MISRLLLALIAFYRYVISPLMMPRCRFYPSCSCYAAEAIATHGGLRGSWLALRRLLRCHPWSRTSGVDLVPSVADGHHYRAAHHAAHSSRT